MSQFDNISEEAERVEQECRDAADRFFHPDLHDDGDRYETARDSGVEFYQLLTDMHEQTRLSVVAGMYHRWDKSSGRFLVRELRFSGLTRGRHTRRALWKCDSARLEELLLALGLDVRSFPQFDQLEAMRLVVNVFKHGEGPSLDQLKERFPEFVSEVWLGTIDLADDTSLAVTDEHVEEFSSAIEAFWTALPEELTVDAATELNLPKEITSAYTKDVAEAPPSIP